MSNLSRFLNDLKRRRIYQVAAVYVVFGLSVLGAAELTLGALELESAHQLVVILTLVGLPVAAVGTWAYELRSNRSAPVVEPAPMDRGIAAAEKSDDGRPSLVVLPFDNISPDAEDAYFAEGLHLEITSRLQDISALSVLSRTSALKYRNAGLTLPEIGTELGVDYILEGAARRAGSEMRLSVRLTEARNDKAVWSREYDRIVGLDALLKTQADVAAQVAMALSATILPEEAGRLTEGAVTHLDAYDLYLRATSLGNSPNELAEAEKLLEGAVEIDPTFTRGWVQLTFTRLMLWRFGAIDSPDRARHPFEVATGLDPAGFEVLMVNGLFHDWVTQDFKRATEYYRLAVDSRPNDINALWAMGRTLVLSGDPRAALPYVERALALAPAESELALMAAVWSVQLHDLDRGERYLAHALRVGSDKEEVRHVAFAFYLRALGDVSRAEQLRDELESAGHPQLRWWPMDLAYYRRDFEGALSAVLSEKPGGPEDDASGLMHWPWQLLAAVLCQRLGRDGESIVHADALIETLAGALDNEPDAFPHLSAARHAWLSVAYAVKRDAERATQARATALQVAPPGDTVAFVTAETARGSVLMGRYDDALDSIEELLSSPMGVGLTVRGLKAEPIWDPLRDHPRYQHLLQEYDPLSSDRSPETQEAMARDGSDGTAGRSA